ERVPLAVASEIRQHSPNRPGGGLDFDCRPSLHLSSCPRVVRERLSVRLVGVLSSFQAPFFGDLGAALPYTGRPFGGVLCVLSEHRRPSSLWPVGARRPSLSSVETVPQGLPLRRPGSRRTLSFGHGLPGARARRSDSPRSAHH